LVAGYFQPSFVPRGCAYAVLYGASTSLPGLLQSLFGYNALQAGLVMSPAGFFAVLTMPVVARVLGRQTDARWVIMVGLLVMAAGNYWMSQLNLDISPGQAVWPRVALIVGLAICFAPANVAAYLYTPKELRAVAVGLLSLLRNEGGSVGTSLSQALHERREQFHTLRLGEYLDPFNSAVHSFTEEARALFLQQTGDPVVSQELAWQALVASESNDDANQGPLGARIQKCKARVKDELRPKVGDGMKGQGGVSRGCSTPPLLHRRSDTP
jgi:MFS transporter, DHA2 family, multidrug resistance protein